MTANIKQGEMPILVAVLIALGYKAVGSVDFEDYLPKYLYHTSMRLDGNGRLSSGVGGERGDVDVPTFIAEAARVAIVRKDTKTVQLNDSYEAEITKDGVKVGCQTFSHEKILEVARAVEEVTKNSPKKETEYVPAVIGDVVTKDFRWIRGGRNEKPISVNIGRKIDSYEASSWKKPRQ